MQVHTFIAATAAEALAKIRETLGPDAVVLNVRRQPAQGLAGLWQKPRIEVLAHLPDKPPPDPEPSVLAALREELREIRERVDRRNLPPDAHPEPGLDPASFQSAPGQDYGGWRVGGWLERGGILPLHVQSIVDRLRRQNGDVPPAAIADELAMTRVILEQLWRAPIAARSGAHVFIGSPGSGKTTALCKWLARETLVHGRPAAVWRLDAHVSNTAESLSVYCEILGVPLERFQPAEPARSPGLLFIDLPGVHPSDPGAMKTLADLLRRLPSPQVHLVLNAAYETPLLLAQIRAFSAISPCDLIITHLDEEPRWGKIWNFVLGTNCIPRFLGVGQNVPGEFLDATPAALLARQFPEKAPLLRSCAA